MANVVVVGDDENESTALAPQRQKDRRIRFIHSDASYNTVWVWHYYAIRIQIHASVQYMVSPTALGCIIFLMCVAPAIESNEKT